MSDHYEVIAVSAEYERLKKYGQKNGVRVFPVEMTREITPVMDLKALFNLYRFLRKEKPLIIHTHTPKAGIIGMLAGKLAKVPIRLHTVAGLPLLEVSGNKRKILDRVEKLTYQLATKVYPNSFELKKIILDLGYAQPAKLKVLGKGSSNGIDTAYFDPLLYSSTEIKNIKSNLNIPGSDFVYVFVGRLVKEKGINELVNAFVDLNNQNPETSLLLVGPFENELDPLDENVIRTIKSHPKIFSTGYQEDVRPYFAVADVLTFPSYREGFPNVVMQANSMNLPAIVSDINGCNEIVKDRENGIIIPVKNEEALKKAMQEILNNPSLFSRLSQNARKLIVENYERGQFWNILLKEYKELELIYKHD
ncbi:glycosyltransferase family 1 protein [Gramella sp. BOM4]|nr:glycosyltransferase family 1 protein [Christiangramia bathymodioli]